MNPLSIGSFFHEDIAYLAALEATGKQSPEIERKQNAWWNLLLWYLNDDLKSVEQSLNGQPFLDWIPRQEGQADGNPVFDRLTWLERDRRVIGIVSPVLLVRPLPDENLSNKIWETSAPLTDRVRGRLTELVKNLKAKAADAKQKGPVPFCCRLASVIEARNVAPPVNSSAGDVVLTPFRFLDPYTLESTQIQIPTGEGAFLVPICSNDGHPLLPSTVPIDGETASFTLNCEKCGSPRNFTLSDFFTAWADDDFVVWRERNLQWAEGAKTVRMPPVPIVDPDRARVTFSYPPISILADLDSRDLTFTLKPQTPIRSIDRVTDLNYGNYLWPGDPDPNAPVAAVPIPVKIENANLVDKEKSHARRINKTVEVTLAFKGLPEPISWIFIPTTIATSSLAIYPNPQKVPPTWSWFDIATDDALQVRLPANAKAARTIGSNRVRSETTGTALPAVELSSKAGSGSCSLVFRRKDDRATTEAREFFVGFDFGSSNTALCFNHQGLRHLSSKDLQGCVAVLIRGDTASQTVDRIAPKSSADGLSFESSYCPTHKVARVTGTSCCNETPKVLFKSDDHASAAAIRTDYITEMLIHGIIGFSKQAGADPVVISGVFSYPLTFTEPRIRVFVNEINDVIGRVSARTGGDADKSRAKTEFVDEATAGVMSLGQPQADELVLTADLGGGTLDISVGRDSDGLDKDQIGSAELGGSHFLRRGANAELPAYANTASRIARGDVDRDEWAALEPNISRYYQLLFVFLETVLGSYIVRRAQHKPVKTVSVYPLGNGWRFHELMVNPRQIEPGKVVRQEIERLARNLADAIQKTHGVTVDLQPQFVEAPKGAVAKGCLRVATMTGKQKPREVTPLLPFGIDSSNGSRKVEWHELFQGDVARTGFVNNGLDFDQQALKGRLQTENGKTWASEEFSAGALRADLQKKEYFWPGAGFFTRGPLQVLIEQQWLPKA